MEEYPPELDDSRDNKAEKLFKLNALASCAAFGIVCFAFLVFKNGQETWGLMMPLGKIFGPYIGVPLGFILDIILAGLMVGALLSIPVTMIAGICGVISSLKYGKLVLLYGLIAIFVSALLPLIWIIDGDSLNAAYHIY